MIKLSFTVLVILTILISCSGMPQTDTMPERDQQPTVSPDEIESSIPLYPAEILKRYATEGFIDQDTYAIILVRPYGTSISDRDITTQAENRAYVSLRRYLREQGVVVSGNTNAALLNLVENNGKLKRVKDTERSSTVYVFIIKRDRLKHYLDNM